MAFLFFTNIEVVALKDTAGAFSLSVVAIGVLLLTSGLIVRDTFKSTLFACVFYLLMMNYTFVQNIISAMLPMAKYWHIAPVLIVLFLHLAYFVYKKAPDDFFNIGTQVLGLVFSLLIVFNIVLAVPSVMKILQNRPDQPKSEIGNSINAEGKQEVYPNIYYLLFDEYSNFPVLEKFYQYDNAPLRNFLEGNGFTISIDSHNESGATVVVTTNNLNLNYVATSLSDYQQYRENPKLFEILDKYGYEIHYLSGLPIQWQDSQAGEYEATTVDGLRFEDIFFKQTIFYPFFRDTENEYTEAFYQQFDYLNQSICLQPYNTFVYVHFDFPHMPFVFNENGRYVGMENRNNTTDERYYLGQLKYTTKYMCDSLEKILKEDPNCIIILQSDHSNRFIGAPVGQESLSKKEDYTNILNAIYYQGMELPEINGLSSVNTLRTVLNKILDEKLAMIEVPSYE